MQSIIIKRLSDELETNPDLTEIRRLMTDSIEALVEANRYSMTQEAQAHFTNAIGSLMLNISSAKQPTKAGLAISVQDLEHALNALNDRRTGSDSRPYTELITCDILLDAIKSVREMLPLTTGVAAIQQTSGA